LLDRFHRGGDADAFEAIVRRHGPRVLSAARHVLGHSPDADDVFQAAFLALAREAGRIRRRPALGGWLYSVAHRLALLARAAAARRARIESRRAAPVAVEPPDPAVREAGDILHEELNRLPEALRLPLLLCYLDGMTRDEAARELGVGVDVLRGRLERGRGRLRSGLVRRGISLPAGLLAAAVGPTAAAPSESLVRAALAGATAGTAPAAVRTLIHLRTASMILARTKLAAVVVATVGLMSFAVALGVAGTSGGGPTAQAEGAEPVARPADPVTPRQPIGDEPPMITGRVVDEAGGPVAGAQVWFAGFGKDNPTAATDRGGAFRLVLPGEESSRPFRRTVIAADPDGRRQGVAYFSVVRDARNLRVTLRPARATTVRVRDAAKQPVAGARVVLMSAELTQLATGATAGDGTAVVRYPAEVEAGFVFALKGGVGFDYATTLKEKQGRERLPLPADVSLVLSGARTVRVKAVDGADRPVAGLTVYPWYFERPDRAEHANVAGCGAVQAVTDAGGVATFDWIPADVGPGVTFLSRSREYSYFEPLLLKADSPAEGGTLRMIRMARLSGRVLGPDGTPAAGVAVEASGVGSAFHHGRGHVTTRADGTYEMTVNGEEAYAVAVVDDRLAAATRPCVVARENATVGGLDFRLAEGTVLRGRMTVGAERRPVAGEYLILQEQAGTFPEELRKKGDRVYHEVLFTRSATTDADGNYRFRVGPGVYTLLHSATLKSVKLTIDREREVVSDIHLPRPDLGRLTGAVVDADGRPVAGATVHSSYMAHTNRVPFEATTTAGGTFAVERVMIPAAVYARSADKSLAGLSRITADQERVTVRVGPLATARGRLLDHDGKAVPGGRVRYGVRIPVGEGPNPPHYAGYGGVAVADGDGWYTCTGMLVGEEYHLSYEQTPDEGPWTGLTTVTPTKAETIRVGDTKLPRPYRPPTLEETTAQLFARRGDLPDRVAAAQAEARRLHLRVLLVVGDPREAATRMLVELTEKQRDVAAAMQDFERVAVSAADTAGLAAFRQTYDRDRRLNRWPALVVLGDDGKVLAAECPALGDSKAAAADLRAFLSSHAPPRPDAEVLLAAARTRARAEGKRVFLKETAAWCAPCRQLSRFLDQHRAVLEPHFVLVDIDRGRYTRGDEVMGRYRGKEGGGIPWCAVLDADGKMLANWDGPGGNIGFPTSRAGIDHFMRVLADTAPRLTDGQRAELRRALERSP
jgi:RNA polymerase sigma factor (sigma-70 family)